MKEPVSGTLEEIAGEHLRVRAEPPPKAFLARFADSGIELELGVWIGDPEIGTLNLRSELNLAIWCAFQEAGIEIPYPQSGKCGFCPAQTASAADFGCRNPATRGVSKIPHCGMRKLP